MRGVILGTGGYYPNERRHTTCVMLPEIGVVFDAGTSFFRVPDLLQTDEVHILLQTSGSYSICSSDFGRYINHLCLFVTLGEDFRGKCNVLKKNLL